MNYLLFTNPHSGSPIFSGLMKIKPPGVVVTTFREIDSWKRIALRFLKGNFSVEDKLRFFYKIEFHDYRSINFKRLKQIIEKNKIEIGFITSFPFFIPKEIIDLFPKGIYNFHPSLLPKHGGPNPFFWIIFEGDQFTGTTCHRVTDVPDHGQILFQSKYPVGNRNAIELYRSFVKDIITMFPEILSNFEQLVKDSKDMVPVEYDPKCIPGPDCLDSLSEEQAARYKKAIIELI
jgi:methionyl-tRNA formyltransferase